MAAGPELRQRAEAFLTQSETSVGEREAMAFSAAEPFSLFVPSDLKAAIDLAAEFMAVANTTDTEEGLQRVLEMAETAARTRNLELVKYALMVFITHHPRGRALPIPPLEQRSREIVRPSAAGRLALAAAAAAAVGPEDALAWFREDTWLNDHHAKWHIVYPGAGHPNPQNPQQMVLRSRQGELFYYMHQQMLARYDTERVTLGLPLTVPLANFTAPIAEGYEANLPRISNRAPNATFRDLNRGGAPYRVQDHADRRDRLQSAAAAGALTRGGGASIAIADVSALAAAAESTVGSVDGASWSDPLSFYGSYHNFGHVLIAELADPAGPNPTSPGVMTSTATAMRDPAFYRWHRHIDDLFFAWQERHQPPYTFADAPQGVIVRKGLAGWPAGDSPDIIVFRRVDVPGGAAPGFDPVGVAIQTFGGVNWDLPRASFPMPLGVVETHMRSEPMPMPDGTTIGKPYLDHDDFFYCFRIENRAAQVRPVTVRVFLAAAGHADNRRMWIEMDKFGVTLPAAQRAVVVRPSLLSSVARKPAWRPTEPRPALPPGTPADAQSYCDCGWPYHLLLPQGSQAGMAFRLMAIMTDWTIDRAGADSACGSLSFCGARDTDYPDSRAMGYPFDRPPAVGVSVSQMIAHPALTHMAATTVTVTLT